MGNFIKGDDFQNKGSDHKTFGIHNETPGVEWGNQIEVYGDPDLRDRILRLLQVEEAVITLSQVYDREPDLTPEMLTAGHQENRDNG